MLETRAQKAVAIDGRDHAKSLHSCRRPMSFETCVDSP